MSRQKKQPSSESGSSAPMSSGSSGVESSGPSNSRMQELMSTGAGLDAVQKFSEGMDVVKDPNATKARAAEGASQSGTALPHRSVLEQLMGVDLSGVKAVTGGEGASAASDIGAKAYNQGDTVVFQERSPSVELVAHEVAHVFQQGSLEPTSGVSQLNDAGEQGAEAVAQRVKRGESAADLMASASPGASDAVQKYTEQNLHGYSARVSDSGKSIRMANQTLYLAPDLMATANAKLRSTGKDGSYVELFAATDSITHQGQTLSRVMPKFVPHAGQNLHNGLESANSGGADTEGNVSDKFALWSDCGRSSAAVMGSEYTDRQAVYNRNGKEVARSGMKDRNITGAGDSIPGKMANQVYIDGMSEYLWKNVNDPGLVKDVHYREEGGNRKAIWPQNSLHARQQYAALSLDGQRAVDQQLGINAFASPDVGEGFTMATEYQMPGAAEVPGKNRWNFHWAGVIAKDGADVISLENYAVTSDYAATKGVSSFDFVDRAWNFEMYGTKTFDQTFHAQHLATGTHGTKATTMRVRTQK